MMLNHYGASFNAKRIPASFRDTANAVQQKAFELKDAVLLVDDYAPSINPIEQRRMAGEAQKMVRAWGDRAERGRMNADGTLRLAKPPRGLGMMTGEDLPDVGQSGVARLFVVDVRPGDVSADEALTVLQRKAHDGLLACALRGYIEWLLPQMDDLPGKLSDLFHQYREEMQSRLMGAHGRQPEAVAWLLVGYHMMLRYWEYTGISIDLSTMLAKAQDVLLDHSGAQRKTLRDEDPVGLFLTAFKELLVTNQITICDLTSRDSMMYAPENCAGYRDGEFIYLIPGQVYGFVCSHFREQGTGFPISAAQLWKRMREREMIEARDKEVTRTKHIPGKGSLRLLWLKQEVIETPPEVSDGFTIVDDPTPLNDPSAFIPVQEAITL